MRVSSPRFHNLNQQQQSHLHHHPPHQQQQQIRAQNHHNGKFMVSSPSSSPEHVAHHPHNNQHQQQQHQQQQQQNYLHQQQQGSPAQVPQHFVRYQQQPTTQLQSQNQSSDDASSIGSTTTTGTQQMQTQHQHQQQHQQQQQQQQQYQQRVGQFASFEPSVVNKTVREDQGPTILGDRFLLVGPAEGSTLYRCVDTLTGQQLVAKAVTMGEKSTDALLQAHMRLEGSGAASSVAGLVDAGKSKRYLLLEGHHGDLHAYVRARRRLREPEARRLFRQAARAVSTCHDNGVVLRDLKLRKFVFADEARTKLRLESLEDAVLVGESDDRLSDRRGCPAYVAPEVLRSGRAYSGKAADMWSLGVLLYTMLVGRYPFNDAEHASLFAKISRGHFAVPDALSPRARCLVRALLRKEPSERPLSDDVLRHPWLSKPLRQQTYPNASLMPSTPAGSSPAGSGSSNGSGGHHQGGQQSGCHQARSQPIVTPDQMVPEISIGGQD